VTLRKVSAMNDVNSLMGFIMVTHAKVHLYYYSSKFVFSLNEKK